MARSASSQENERRTPSRLSDGSQLPPPPRVNYDVHVQQWAKSEENKAKEEIGTPKLRSSSYLGRSLHDLQVQLGKRDEGIYNDLEALFEVSDRFKALESMFNQALSDNLAAVVARVEEKQKELVQRLAEVENVQLVSVKSAQKDLQLKIEKIQSGCDSRAIQAAQETAKQEVASVEKLVDALSKTVDNTNIGIQARINELDQRIRDLAETVTRDKQSRVEDIHKRGKGFEELSERVIRLERERGHDKQEREDEKQERERDKHERAREKRDREQERQERAADKKSLDDTMKQHRSNRTQGSRAPSVLRPSPSPSKRNTVSGLLGPYPPRRESIQDSAPGDQRKRQASPSESPSRLSKAKRAKGPVCSPSTPDSNRSRNILQSRGTTQASKPAASERPEANTKSAPGSQPRSTPQLDPNSTAASTPKPKQVKKEPAMAAAKQPRAATPETLTKAGKDKFRFVRELAHFDFTDFPKYKALHEDHLEATHHFPLFNLEINNDMYQYFLHTGETVEPCPREQVDKLPKESRQTDTDRRIVRGLRVIEARKSGGRGRAVDAPSYYLLCLGEVYKSTQSSRASRKESTGWFVFVDVASKEKPVYMIWREKTYKNGLLVSSSPWNCNTLGLRPGRRWDFFVLLPSITTWPADPNQVVVPDHKIKRVLELNGSETHMVFTRPLCKFLVERLGEAWNKSVTFQEMVRAGAAGLAA